MANLREIAKRQIPALPPVAPFAEVQTNQVDGDMSEQQHLRRSTCSTAHGISLRPAIGPFCSLQLLAYSGKKLPGLNAGSQRRP
jgi:hypothetical protein